MKKDWIVMFADGCITKLRKNTREAVEEVCAQGWENSCREMRASMSVEFTSRQELFSVHNTWALA